MLLWNLVVVVLGLLTVLITTARPGLVKKRDLKIYSLPKYGKVLAGHEEERKTLTKTILNQDRHRQREMEKERERMLNVNGQIKKERERERMREREEERKRLGPDGKVIIALQKEGERERQRMGPNGLIQRERKRYRFLEEGDARKMKISPNQAV